MNKCGRGVVLGPGVVVLSAGAVVVAAWAKIGTRTPSIVAGVAAK